MNGRQGSDTWHGESTTTDRRSGARTGRAIRGLWLAGFLALSLLALGAVPGSAVAAGNDAVEHSSCTTITTEGEHVLSADITDPTNTECIEIEASNVTFDGNGHTVDGTEFSSSKGVYVDGPATNVTITNLTVSDWATGVYLWDSSNGTVRNVTATSNTLAGFNFYASRNYTVQEVTITDNADGLYFTSLGTDNVVTDSTIVDNDGWEVFMDSWSGDAPTNRFENLDVGASTAPNTTLSFTGRAVVIDQVSSPPADPSGRVNASRYLNVTGIVDRSYLDFALSYADSDVASGESSLALFEHDGTGWTELPGSTVDTTGNELSANYTSVPVSESYPVSSWTTLGALSLGYSIDRCTVIDSPGRYELATDVTNATTDTCIEVAASDVVVDGNGHTIDGVDGAGTGVESDSGTGSLSNVTVRNLTVTDWQTGLRHRQVPNVTVEDVTATNNEDIGIYLQSSPDSTVRDSTVRSSGTGVYIQGGEDLTVADSSIRSITDDGVLLVDQVDDATIRANTIVDADVGVSMTPYVTGVPSGTTLRDNVIRDARIGVSASGATGTTSTGDRIANTTRVLDLSDGATSTASGLDVGTSTVPNTTLDVEARDVILRSVDAPPPAPANETAIGHYVNVTNTTATGYLDVDVRYDEDSLDDVDETTLGLYRHDGTGWHAVQEVHRDATRNVVGANLTGSGDVGVFGRVAVSDGPGSGDDPANSGDPSPDIRIAETSLSSTSIEPGDAVAVTVDVSNAGGGDGTHTVTLRVEGETVDATTVFVAAGTSRTITFSPSFETVGEYALTADGASAGTVTVAAGDPTQTTTEPSSRTTPDEQPPTGATPTETETDGGAQIPSEDGDGIVPLAGVGLAIVLVSALALLAGRRDG